VIGKFGWFQTFRPDTAAALFKTSFWSVDPMPDATGVLIRELIPLLAHTDERAGIGRCGRSFATANFGLTAMAERLATIYKEAHSGYGVRDWVYDQRLEGQWVMGWLGRHVFPSSSVSARIRAWSDGARARSQLTAPTLPPVDGGDSAPVRPGPEIHQ
jgi:hypothetical protein